MRILLSLRSEVFKVQFSWTFQALGLRGTLDFDLSLFKRRKIFLFSVLQSSYRKKSHIDLLKLVCNRISTNTNTIKEVSRISAAASRWCQVVGAQNSEIEELWYVLWRRNLSRIGVVKFIDISLGHGGIPIRLPSCFMLLDHFYCITNSHGIAFYSSIIQSVYLQLL